MSGEEVLARVGLPDLGEVVVVERRWCWVGQVLRWGGNRVAKRLLLWSAGEGEEEEGWSAFELGEVAGEGWEFLHWGALSCGNATGQHRSLVAVGLA